MKANEIQLTKTYVKIWKTKTEWNVINISYL